MKKQHRGQILRALRQKAGLTQEELANLLGVTKSAISKYEKGQRSFDDLKLIEKAAQVFQFLHRYSWKKAT